MDEGRDFTTKQRKAAAGTGAALKDGSFPIKNKQDLRNAVQALGRAKDTTKAKRHIIKRARALGLIALLPKEWDVSHEHSKLIPCTDEACQREFLTETAMLDHAQAVHTFDDIRRMVSDKVRDIYGRRADYTNKVEGIYVYVLDLADDWVVFEREGSGSDLWKASYSIVDGVVTLGEPTQVQRRTVFEPVKDGGKLEKVNADA